MVGFRANFHENNLAFAASQKNQLARNQWQCQKAWKWVWIWKWFAQEARVTWHCTLSTSTAESKPNIFCWVCWWSVVHFLWVVIKHNFSFFRVWKFISYSILKRAFLTNQDENLLLSTTPLSVFECLMSGYLPQWNETRHWNMAWFILDNIVKQ